MSGETDRSSRVRSELVRLVSQYGPAVLDDVRRVRAMLSDAVPGATAEANVIGLALGVGVPARLRDASSDPARSATALDDVSRELERSSSVQPADARWAVGAIAEALGVQPGARPPAATAPPEGDRTAVPGGSGAGGELTVTWPGGRASAPPGRTLSIGRDPGADVVLASNAVSRRHGELASSGTGWTYTDLGSTQGSFVGGQRVTSTAVSDGTVLVLGQGAEQVTLQLSVAGAAAAPPPPAPAPPAPAAPLRPAVTEVRPGGALAAAAAAPTEVGRGSGDVVTVSLGGQSRTAAPGGGVSIGRETDNDLVASATTASRHHARVEHRGGAWTLVDLGSTSGTWLDGQRVTEVRLSGRQTFTVGDPSTGDALTTDCAQQAAGPVGRTGAAATGKPSKAGAGSATSSRKPLLVIAAAVVALLVLGSGVLYALTRDGGDDDPAPVAAEVTDDDLARATVFLVAGDRRGSGVIVDAERGLILTNAHVAAPGALGLAVVNETFAPDMPENPDEVLISVSAGRDKAAEPAFRGKVIASDGYLDAAVVQITKTASGSLVEPANLEDLQEVQLGDSEAVKTSDEVEFFGYPAVSGSRAPTRTDGTIAGPIQDERLETSRAVMNTTAKIFSGNSGGLAADAEGRMIGITTWSRGELFGESLSSYRPINLVKPVIEAARKIADEDKGSYRSPWVARATGATRKTEKDPSYAVGKRAGAVTAGCRTVSRPGVIEALSLRYENLPSVNGHADVYAEIRRNGTVVATSTSTFPTKLPRKGCMTLTFDDPLPRGSYRVIVGVGGNLKPILNQGYDF